MTRGAVNSAAMGRDAAEISASDGGVLVHDQY